MGVHVFIYSLTRQTENIQQGCKYLSHSHWLSDAEELKTPEHRIFIPYMTPAKSHKGEISNDQRENLIIVNGHDPSSTDGTAVLNYCHDKDCKVTPLRGFNMNQLLELYRRAKIVVGFCMRGCERSPIEAVLAGAVLVSNTCLAAQDRHDFPIPKENLVTANNPVEEVLGRILANFEAEQKKMSDMRALYQKIGPDTLAKQTQGFIQNLLERTPAESGPDHWNGALQLVSNGFDKTIPEKFTCTVPEADANILSMQRNIESYERTFDKNRSLVLTMASSAQLQLLQVWMDVPHRKYNQVVVLALGKETAKHCCEKNIPFLYDDNQTVGSGQDMLFLSEQFLKLGITKFTALKKVVEAGYSIIFSELDVNEFVDPEQCGSGNERHQQQLCGVPSRESNFDIEIQPNMDPGKLARPGTELNIGFFYLRASNASIALLHEVVKRLDSERGWDQNMFTRIAWNMQCCAVDDNSNDTQSTTSCTTNQNEKCLRMRVLSAYYFPTGGLENVRQSWSQYGIVPPDYYNNTKTCPTLVHCTGRTGLDAKMDCAKRVRKLCGNFSSDLLAASNPMAPHTTIQLTK